MERSNPPSYSSTGSGQTPQGPRAVGRPGTGWEDKKIELIRILGVLGQQHLTSESRVLSFLSLLDKSGVPITDHANVNLVFSRWRVAVASVRARGADPSKTRQAAPGAPAPDASHPAGLKAMFAQEGTFKARPASFIAKFVAFVGARDVDPTDKDVVAALLPPFLNEIEKATAPTARALIQAVEAGDADQVARMLEAGLDPARIVLRPDPPPNRRQVQEFARLAARYESAASESRGPRFTVQAFQVLPSLTDTTRPKYPGRNALTLALACNAGKVVSTICLWVDKQREAGKTCDLLDRADGQGCTPLIMAVETGNWPCVRLLLDRGANIDMACPRPNYAYSALMAAVSKEDRLMISGLLERGADPLIVGPQGDRALSLALQTNDVEALKLLLAALPNRLEGTAEEWETSGSLDSAVRLFKAATDLDDLLTAAVRGGDEDLKERVRACRDLAHRLRRQADERADKERATALMPPVLEEVEEAAPPTACTLIQAIEAGDGKQIAQMLKAGLDPARIVLRPDRPPSRQDLQHFARLAARYGAAPPKSRGVEFLDQARKVLPSLNDPDRPNYPGRNALTLALACGEGSQSAHAEAYSIV